MKKKETDGEINLYQNIENISAPPSWKLFIDTWQSQWEETVNT